MGDGFFNKLKSVIGIEEIEDIEEIEEAVEEEFIKPVREQKKIEFKPATTTSSYGTTARTESKGESRIVNMQQTQTKNIQFKMVVIEPKGFEECPKLVDNLKSKKPVIINLEKNSPDVARKIFDFLSGAIYALDGNVQKVANNIFIFAPENVDVAANFDNKTTDFDDNFKNPWK